MKPFSAKKILAIILPGILVAATGIGAGDLATAGFSGYLGSQSYKQGAMGFKKGADDELSNAYKAACILSGFAALLVLIAHFKAGAYGYSLRLLL